MQRNAEKMYKSMLLGQYPYIRRCPFKGTAQRQAVFCTHFRDLNFFQTVYFIFVQKSQNSIFKQLHFYI